MDTNLFIMGQIGTSMDMDEHFRKVARQYAERKARMIQKPDGHFWLFSDALASMLYVSFIWP
jgi:hypothetical protein